MLTRRMDLKLLVPGDSYFSLDVHFPLFSFIDGATRLRFHGTSANHEYLTAILRKLDTFLF